MSTGYFPVVSGHVLMSHDVDWRAGALSLILYVLQCTAIPVLSYREKRISSGDVTKKSCSIAAMC